MNNRIKVGIIIENSLDSGGIFSNEISFVKNLEKNHEIDTKVFTTNKKNINYLKKIGLDATFIGLSVLDYFLCKIKMLSQKKE